MKNKENKDITDSNFLASIDFLNNKIINENLISEANEFIFFIKNILDQNKNLDKDYPDIYYKLNDYLINSKFIVLDHLDEKEIIFLLDKYLDKIFSLPMYDILQKIKNKLSTMEDLGKRDKFKKELKNILLKSKFNITEERIKIEGDYFTPTVANWLRDYNLATDFRPFNKIKKNQYFINNKNIKNLNPIEKKKIKILFNLYEKLQISSLSAEGFENSFVAVLPDDDIAIYSDGVLNKVDPQIKMLVKAVQGRASYNNGILGIPKTEAEKEIDVLIQEKEKYKDNSLEKLALEEEIGFKKKIDDLQIEINKYKENSLERKALEDELNKIKSQ